MTALSVIAAFLLSPVSHTLEPQTARASDGGGSLALMVKEYGLDTIAWMAMDEVIHEITGDIVKWINEGFDGNPRFVREFDKMLLDVADDQVGSFIYGSDLRMLCSPFQLEVSGALLMQYSEGRDFDVQCTLTDVVENAEGFFGGDFLAGGWDGWFEMTQRPENNPYGAFVLGQEEMGVRIRNAEGEQINLFEVGRGMITTEFCEDIEVHSPGAAGPHMERHCETVTPGSVIEEKLNSALDMGERRMLVADEINEVIGALIARLGREALNNLREVDYEGVRNNEGERRGYIHEEDPEAQAGEGEFTFTTSCSDDLTTCNSDGTFTVTVPESGEHEVCGFGGDPNSCQTISDPSGNSSSGSISGGGGGSTEDAIDDEFNDSGLPGDPIEEGPGGEPHPNPTPGLPNPGEGGSPGF